MGALRVLTQMAITWSVVQVPWSVVQGFIGSLSNKDYFIWKVLDVYFQFPRLILMCFVRYI